MVSSLDHPPYWSPLGLQGQNSAVRDATESGKSREQGSLCRLPHPQLCESASREVGGSVQGKEWREAAHSNYVFFELLQAKPLTFISKNGSF